MGVVVHDLEFAPMHASILQTDKGFLHIYNIHQTKEPVLPGSTAARDICKADVYLRHTAKLEMATTALSITGDAKTLLLGCHDGSFVACTWTGKVRLGPAHRMRVMVSFVAAVHYWPCALHAMVTHFCVFVCCVQLRGDLVRPLQQEWAGDEVPGPGISSMQYCEKTKCLVAVLTDGSCAMLGIGAGGITQVHEIVFRHWVCAAHTRAVCARIGASAQMVAVGCANGTVALYK